MSGDSRFTVRFLLSNNVPGSVTRITADTANVFVRLGVPTTVMFPAVDWWDYKLFCLRSMGFAYKCKQTLKLAGEVLTRVPFRRSWCGLKVHDVNPQVQVARFVLSPSAAGWKDGITVVHPPYFIPHLLRTMTDGRMKIVSAVHVNLEKAMNSPSPEVAAWYRRWVALERFLLVPRYATSEKTRRAAERLGIPVRKVIHGGIDLHLFRPGGLRTRDARLVVSLYCDPNVQKGREVGIEAFKALKTLAPQVRLSSIGNVSVDQANVFDLNYGYLHGQDYVRAIQESDIFVYPSWYDGFPAPPLHAMACGTALVTTAVEGVEEYAVEGQNCLLAEPGSAEMIVRQIMRLIKDVELRQRLQANGPKVAEEFSADAKAKQLLEFLQEVYEEQHLELASGPRA